MLGNVLAATHPGARVEVAGDGAGYAVEGTEPDPALVAALATWCAGAGRLIVEARTTGGTLEEAYLELVSAEREATA